jgi:hypothetical protein
LRWVNIIKATNNHLYPRHICAFYLNFINYCFTRILLINFHASYMALHLLKNQHIAINDDYKFTKLCLNLFTLAASNFLNFSYNKV